jgi:hypothetical protein
MDDQVPRVPGAETVARVLSSAAWAVAFGGVASSVLVALGLHYAGDSVDFVMVISLGSVLGALIGWGVFSFGAVVVRLLAAILEQTWIAAGTDSGH